MKRTDVVFIISLIALAAFVGLEARDAERISPRGSDGVGAPTVNSTSGSVAYVEKGAAGSSDRSVADRDVAEVQQRLRLGAAGTYIGEVLLTRDSALARWSDRRLEPLRVWVQRASAVPDFHESYPGIVRDAFEDWSTTGIPLAFTFVNDSVSADVHVTWIDHFDESISGKTLWAHDDDWYIVEANIILALHHNGGDALDASAVRAIALHEVGHLIGLDHTTDASNIMTPKVRVKELSPADRATARLLYLLPPGPVK